MKPARKLWPERKDTIQEEQTKATDPTNSRTYHIVKLLILIILYYVIIFM